jgi:energy-coupling factor transporter ATP-binding protein EcfA2
MARSSTRLVLICGLPGSGKSTLARQLAPKIPAIRLDKDGWATQLGADLWDDEFRVRLERQLWVLSQDLLARGQSVILEWGHWARVERDEKRLRARALGVGGECPTWRVRTLQGIWKNPAGVVVVVVSAVAVVVAIGGGIMGTLALLPR